MSAYQKEELHSRDPEEPAFTRHELIALHEAVQRYVDDLEGCDRVLAKAAESAWQKLDDWIAVNVDPDTGPPDYDD